MSACEECWTEANWRAMVHGGSVVDHYRALLDEPNHEPLSPAPEGEKR